ncbi:coenzyme F420-0:L-glutamate ligase [Candidatus Methanoperedens nitratireducens]|uniref:Coenzyme F420:L-glutamate ligase n=1 Tax=Candidatus Methanoperedens nitratireducens TaxID=1392998 RepID=A0A284VM82_9EURY|nr:coenzyme F420-0:L-glutamate ligase [Candidatus Methanoperedens nitroreducens]SNQ60317.1 Coenzyme F420:L-glutamate ligase [Candidatus Methanoperedens nitroreducens]
MKATTFTIEDIPLIKPGDDIGRMIVERAELEEHDIIVISSTIVSKSEDRILSLDKVKVSRRAEAIAKSNDNDPRFVQSVLDQSSEVLIESPFLLVRIKSGSICVNAGIDRSNVSGSRNVLLLPEFPDESAKRVKDTVFKLTGKKVSVIITDTNGRAFRMGQTGAAIGIAGIMPTRDWRGTKDLFGRVLEVKNEAIIDEFAGFANILMGEGNGGTPIVIIRGLDFYQEPCSIKELYRPEEEDMVRRALISRSV